MNNSPATGPLGATIEPRRIDPTVAQWKRERSMIPRGKPNIPEAIVAAKEMLSAIMNIRETFEDAARLSAITNIRETFEDAGRQCAETIAAEQSGEVK